MKRSTPACSKCRAAPRRPSDSYCKVCRAAYSREHRIAYRDLKPGAKRKAIARSAARVALVRGNLKRQPCARCGARRAQIHHRSYSSTLDVEWLCQRCHRVEHQSERAANVPPGLPKGMTAICEACLQPTRGTLCPACRSRKHRGTLGAACAVCNVDNPQVVRRVRLADGMRFLCANHAAVVGRRRLSLATLADELAQYELHRGR